MKEYRFIQVDVFTDKPFGGNPLAVFLDAEGLTTEETQQLCHHLRAKTAPVTVAFLARFVLANNRALEYNEI